MSRLSRKEMKRDEVIETMGSMVNYTRRHGQALVWGGVALLVVLAIVVGMFWWRRAQAQKASSELAEAMDAGAGSQARYEQLVERYPASPAAAAARLILARQAAADGDVERARQLWEEVAGEGAGSVLGLQARLNLYELARQEGRWDELIAELRAASEQDEPDLPRDQLIYQLAITLEASGAADEARQTYQRLIDEYPQSALRAVAQVRADELPGAPADG